jgi:2-methylcitrate dehydratase PrpD
VSDASVPTTERLARFIAESSSSPSAVAEAAEKHIADTIGVLLAGTREPVVAAVLGELVRVFRPETDPPDLGATLLGLRARATVTDAALVNAVAAHAIDYDDVHSHVRGHPSACVLPAALAASESAGLSGAGLIDAYVVGIEAAARIGRTMDASHARQGFHSTSTLGVIGAAAAGARALGLSTEQTAHALGIAASSASGLRRNFGTMTKPLHAGFAARDGLTAALLARRGVTASETVFDDPDSFTATYCPDGGDPAAFGVPGEPWEVVAPGIAIKKYPCCNRGHRAADAVLEIVGDYVIEPEQIASIEVRMPAGQVDERGRVGPMTFPRPQTGLEAKFSMQYVVAAAAHYRALPMSAFTDDGIHQLGVWALMDRVRVLNRADADDRVEVALTARDGHSWVTTVRYSRGDPRGDAPLTWDDVIVKYRDCVGGVLSEQAAEASSLLLIGLGALDDVRTLTALLSGN